MALHSLIVHCVKKMGKVLPTLCLLHGACACVCVWAPYEVVLQVLKLRVCVRMKANLFRFVQTTTTVTTTATQQHQGLRACRRALCECDSSSHSPLPGVVRVPPDTAVRGDGNLACSETKVCVRVKQLFTLFELHHLTHGRPPRLKFSHLSASTCDKESDEQQCHFIYPPPNRSLPPTSSSSLPLFCAPSTSSRRPSRLLRHLSCLPLCTPLE